MKKIIKIIVSMLIVLAMCTTLTACFGNGGGGGDGDTHTWDSGTPQPDATYYSSGTMLFTCTEDSSHTKTETIPVKVATKNDLITAVNKTVGSSQFEYDYNLSITTKIAGINGPTAITDGTLYYNSANSIKYMRKAQSSGALLYDGVVYDTLQGNTLETFKVNERGELYDHASKTVPNNFNFESSSFAKLLFTDEVNNVESLTRQSGNQLKYKVGLPTTAGVISGALSVVNHPIVSKFVSVPDSSGDVEMYVTFNSQDGTILKYEYDFEISIELVSVNFHYDLTFTKVGSSVSITPPSFAGFDLTDSAKTTTLNTIKGELDEYKAQTISGYDFEVKTAVDYAWNSLAVNSTTKGEAVQKKEGGNVYYWNKTEFDSDYKNNDQYGSAIVDYLSYRAKLLNGTVYDIWDRTFPFSNVTEQVTANNSSIDTYYLLLANSLLSTSNVSLIKTETKSQTTTYSLTLNNNGVMAFIDFIDDSVRMDVKVSGADEHAMFNIQSNSLYVDDQQFIVEITNGKLSKITVVIKGSYVDTNDDRSPNFEIEYSIEVGNVTEYDIPEDEGDIATN